MSHLPVKTWDIFCRVIDNYGDIGVCWRLARQLAREYPIQVRLWVDEIAALQHIWPSVTNSASQEVEGVEIRIWQGEFEGVIPADAIVEAFACELPVNYLAAMKRRPTPPYWFNLEYLSAEDWVEGCHGLPSVHPQLGLKKTFFFPGFTAKTGGLLKESSLLEVRDSFLANKESQNRFWQNLGVIPTENELVISLFGYENPAVASLIDSWIQSTQPVLCLVPASKILPSVNSHLGRSLAIGDEFVQGSLRIKIIPFLTQREYDYLLWAADINFIRGEDSFVRAQWAGKPFVWHIYPQDDDIHMVKLDAFLEYYLQGATPKSRATITDLWHRWNLGENASQSWENCLSELQDWQEQSKNWCQHLNSLGDLASNMVRSCI
ncbi:hypothetical protein GCM10011613_13390 [Cellvibrio zantedeschiae]|uniref:Protein-arginine rhamnosyltransferase n=1 Tax=Cellvibrio zantedeschiae TaxID=1237077 RepID=A0ABQ3AZ11_9GAMM|nr:elongation factor P maturation arginine rhamnosyltransferase EarP [Cellvibrio zantedeschiae]GGY70288.1 hypothetical protein GCM10011613_13390 [Cellvibrio zantedeschiae]